MYSVILEPNFDEAYSFLIERISREFLVIFANCKIHYNGRANSIADFADRIILIKTDNTVIIHEGTKREPVNWQPAGCKITLKSSFKYLEMIIERKRPKEILEIYLNKIYYIASSILNSGKFELFGSEKEMIDYVYRNPWIIEEGFKPIQREVRTPYGILDLLGIDKNGNYLILEFKRSIASLQAVSQLYRYYIYFKENMKNVRAGIVAPKISKNAKSLLEKLGLEYFKLEYKLDNKFQENPIIGFS